MPNRGLCPSLLHVAFEKIPIKVVKGAGSWGRFFFDIVFAAAAVIGHFVNVGATGCIRFTGQHTAVGKQDHTGDVGHFYPFVGVGINNQVPLVDRIRVQAPSIRQNCPAPLSAGYGGHRHFAGFR